MPKCSKDHLLGGPNIDTSCHATFVPSSAVPELYEHKTDVTISIGVLKT